MSITRKLANKLDNYDSKSLTESTFSGNNFKARGINAGLVPLTFATSIIDTLTGVFEGIFAGFPLVFLREVGFKNQTTKAICEDSSERIQQSSYIFARPFKHLLRSINPKVFREEDIGANAPLVSEQGIGLIAHQVHKAVMYLLKTDSKLYRHTISRLVCILAPIAFVIARIADGIIGIAAAPFALLSGGCCESLNNVAYRGLQAPGFIFDLFRCAVSFISPPNTSH